MLRRRAASGAVGWTPKKISGVVAWWRADDIAGADGAAVTGWTDRVGGVAVQQATGGQQPLLKTAANGINNQPVVRFASASSQFLSAAIGALPARGPLYVFGICRQTTQTTAKVVSFGKTGSNVGLGFGFSNTGPIMLTTYGLADLSGLYGGPGAGNAGLVLWGHSGTAYAFNRNNLYSLNTAAATNATAGADTFTIGGRSTSSVEFFNGDVAEIVVMTSLPSSGDRYLMAKYANSRYGITVGTPYNSDQPATTPSADASGTCVETSVLYFPSGWNSYNYWCAFVPYGSNNAANENPTILQSNDGNTWQTPSGAPVPVVAYPGGGSAGNNSDPGLFYNPGDGKLYIFYQRENTTPISLGGIWVTSSADGVTWSAPSQIISATFNSGDFEPKVVYNSATSEWWLYTIDAHGGSSATALYRRVSTTGPTTGYGSRVACSVTLPNSRHIWHNGNVVQLAGKWVTTFSDDQATRQMWLASSSDGINWTVRQQPILIASGVSGTATLWDNAASIYRLTLVDSGDGVNAWGWYSTLAGSTVTRMSQKVTIPLSEIP